LYGWLAAAGAFVLTVAGAFFYGREKAKGAAKQEVAVANAEQKVNTAEAIVSRNEVRTDVDAQVAKLPSNPVVEIHVPAPLPVRGSAADELQQQWSRD